MGDLTQNWGRRETAQCTKKVSGTLHLVQERGVRASPRFQTPFFVQSHTQQQLAASGLESGIGSEVVNKRVRIDENRVPGAKLGKGHALS
jgi:hypothetical protein